MSGSVFAEAQLRSILKDKSTPEQRLELYKRSVAVQQSEPHIPLDEETRAIYKSTLEHAESQQTVYVLDKKHMALLPQLLFVDRETGDTRELDVEELTRQYFLENRSTVVPKRIRENE